jgi:hypothetical protein
MQQLLDAVNYPFIFPRTPNESAVLTITALFGVPDLMSLYTNYTGTVIYLN